MKARPVAGPQQVGHRKRRHDQPEQHEIVVAEIIIEHVAEDRRAIRDRAIDATGKPFRAGEEILENELRRQGRNREIEPFEARRWQTKKQTDDHRRHAGERDRQHDRHPVFAAHICGCKRAETKESAVPQRDLAGEADQNVQPDRSNGEDANDHQLVDHRNRRKQRQDQSDDRQDDRRTLRGGRLEERHIRGIAGAEIAAWAWIRDVRHRSNPLDIGRAEEAVWLDHQNGDQDVERRDLRHVADVQILAVNKLGEVLQHADDHPANDAADD